MASAQIGYVAAIIDNVARGGISAFICGIFDCATSVPRVGIIRFIECHKRLSDFFAVELDHPVPAAGDNRIEVV